LALERSLLVPVASDGPPRASPPELAVYGGIGSTDDAANFSCARLDGGHD